MLVWCFLFCKPKTYAREREKEKKSKIIDKHCGGKKINTDQHPKDGDDLTWNKFCFLMVSFDVLCVVLLLTAVTSRDDSKIFKFYRALS